MLLDDEYLEEADRLANRIAVVDGGKVIANDSPERLKAQMGGIVIEMGMPGDGRADRQWACSPTASPVGSSAKGGRLGGGDPATSTGPPHARSVAVAPLMATMWHARRAGAGGARRDGPADAQPRRRGRAALHRVDTTARQA